MLKKIFSALLGWVPGSQISCSLCVWRRGTSVDWAAALRSFLIPAWWNSLVDCSYAHCLLRIHLPVLRPHRAKQMETHKSNTLQATSCKCIPALNKMVPCPFADCKHTCHIVSRKVCKFTVSRWMTSCLTVKEHSICMGHCTVKCFIILYMSCITYMATRTNSVLYSQ